MRYVNEKLVLRLNEPLSLESLNAVKAKFSGVLVDGDFEQTDALPEEKNEPDLAEMKRLVFHFDRRSLAQLRLLINEINRQADA